MPRDDRGEIEMKLLQSLESLRILREVREIEIAELLFENAVPVKNFLLREKHEDTIWRMRGTQINFARNAPSHPSVSLVNHLLVWLR